MEGSRQQFDVLLGGQSQLPSGLNVLNFISARAQEIEALTEAIDEPQKSGLLFQRLPKHMRRRIMSHNVKRMPKRLQEGHLRQMEKSGLPPKSKRPSRKYRRRPSNLLQEYNRRQRKFMWLETHIWHAKRFHMISKWGYKVPHFPNDKNFRACYRASANHCLLQDISYYCCIELCGPETEIIDGLKQLTNTACGLTFGAKIYLNGSREGHVTVFRKNSYPFGAIGNISFLWRPSNKPSSESKKPLNDLPYDERTLWLWVHPAFYQELCCEILDTFNFVESHMPVTEALQSGLTDVGCGEVSTDSSSKHRCHNRRGTEKNVEAEKLGTKTTFYCRTPKYESNNGSVKMVLLKDTLNRFRLAGPLSHSILQHAIHIARINTNNSDDPFTTKNEKEDNFDKNSQILTTEIPEEQCDSIGNFARNDEIMEVDEHEGNNELTEQCSDNDCKWWDSICNDAYNLECFRVQKQVWETMKGATSPAQFPPKSVFGLVVTDPRHHLPAKRNKPDIGCDALWPQEGIESGLKVLPSETSFSPLWIAEVRDAVTISTPSAADIARSRSSSVVPVHENEVSETREIDVSLSTGETAWRKIPILLVQRPGSCDGITKRLGFGCGWDIILPAGWGMPFWLALVFRGARVGGLRESTSLSFESLHGPWGTLLPPDTKAGNLDDSNMHQQLIEAHFRLPPDKRPNFIRLAVASPFMCLWDMLIKEWCEKSSSIDDKKSLNGLSFYVLRDRKKLQVLRFCLDKHIGKKSSSLDAEMLFRSDDDMKCLVPVFLASKDKGIPSDFSMICIPTDEDLKAISSCQATPGPIEPLHEDHKRQERRQLQQEHRKKLKYLRKQRQAQRTVPKGNDDTALQPTNENLSEMQRCIKSSTKTVVEEHARKMSELWLPNADTIKNSGSRVVIGLIYKGGFSFTEGIGMGLGYVSLPALLGFIKSSSSTTPWVLVRNTCSQQYRYAMLHIHSVM